MLIESVDISEIGNVYVGVTPRQLYSDIYRDTRSMTDYNHLLVIEVLSEYFTIECIDEELLLQSRSQEHMYGTKKFCDKNMLSIETVHSFGRLPKTFKYFCELIGENLEADHGYAASYEFLKRLFFCPDMDRINDIHKCAVENGYTSAYEAFLKKFFVVLFAPVSVSNFFIPPSKTNPKLAVEKSLVVKSTLVPRVVIQPPSFCMQGYKSLDLTKCWYDDLST